jgi:hypothetical protein
MVEFGPVYDKSTEHIFVQSKECPRYEVSIVTSYLAKVRSVQGTKWQKYEVS